jgi:chaperonin GroES
MAEYAAPDAAEQAEGQAIPFLLQLAQAEADITPLLDSETIAKIGDKVCAQYEADKLSRCDWEKVAEKALSDMARCNYGEKDYPWKGASNVHYPLLTQAVMQFNARAYPAIVKGDAAVNVKVVGADKGMPMMGPDGQPVMQVQGMPVLMTPQGPGVMTPQGLVPLPESAQPEPVWQREPGAKVKRAARVRDYMNFMLFYRMDNWESETDTLLMQKPAIGCAFRKVWFDGVKHQSRFVPALKLVVSNDAKSLADAPQIAEEIDGVFPHQIKRKIAAGEYRPIYLDPEEKDGRTLIEAQCYYDLDEDGLDEPYIVTVDYKTREVLRIVPDFDETGIEMREDGGVLAIERRTYYVKYEFLPHPEGKFYNIGLAHLLDQYGEVINTIVNQMIDANHAATAGGGFVGSGLRIQGKGQSSTLTFRPGEYKTVPVTGNDLRSGLYERTLPSLSPVMFDLLNLILGAAREIASIKDILSGEASNNGQVGTTLALIEQGLQVFTAIYKRVYRGMKAEFSLLFTNIGRYGDEATAREYVELLDDMAADFEADFASADMDIRPVSDPSTVTKMQQMARAQFILGTADTLQAVGGDLREALRRVYEAADVDDIEKLLPDPEPNPMAEMAMQMDMADKQAVIRERETKAVKNEVEAQAKMRETDIKEADLNLKAEELQFEALNLGYNIAAS